MPQVFVVALGPVQDFIAAARRCRDLWFGSWLLSELSKAAARAIGGTAGATLVFPGAPLAELAPGSETSVANKIVARLEEGVSPVAVAERGRAAMADRLAEIRERAFEKVRDPDGLYFCRQVAVDQVADLIEYVWASAPEGPGGYGEGRRAAEALLASRKNTHLWWPVAWGAPVPKSSVDGERESVIQEKAFDDLSPEALRRRFGIGKAERLCGVGLLKRHGTREGQKGRRYGHHFLSTGHLAAWPLLERMTGLPEGEKQALRALWQELLATLQADGVDPDDTDVYAEQPPHPVLGRSDGGLLFESRLPDLFEGRAPAEIQAPVRRAKEALGRFLKRLGAGEPCPYYAILVADGDCMGKAIELQPEVPGHKALSRALDSFAREAPRIVEREHGGELIYAGGDDVLAFVPLHRALPCAQALKAAFGEALQGFPTAEGTPPTLSVGIGICHFLDPMGGALRVARRAEALAKTTRNALAVIVDKRSGPALATHGPWGTADRDLAEFVELHYRDWLPDGAAYELRELGRLLAGAAGDDRKSLEALVRKEAERILRRKQPKHGEEARISEEILRDLLTTLAERGVPVVADRLILARTLARAQEEARPLPLGGAA